MCRELCIEDNIRGSAWIKVTKKEVLLSQWRTSEGIIIFVLAFKTRCLFCFYGAGGHVSFFVFLGCPAPISYTVQ